MPASGYLCGPCINVIARTYHGNPAVLFSQRYKPHLENWPKKKCLHSTLFRYSARSLHRATKPSRGRLRVGCSKPRLYFITYLPTCTKVTAKERTGVLGCIFCRGLCPSLFPPDAHSRRAFFCEPGNWQKQSEIRSSKNPATLISALHKHKPPRTRFGEATVLDTTSSITVRPAQCGLQCHVASQD